MPFRRPETSPFPASAKADVLGRLCDGRNNNFNLVRIVCAFAVLVSHAWPLTLGPDAVEPLRNALGSSLGTYAVYVFFAISGFLIARSFDRGGSVRRWILARALRLLPGLLVVLLLTVLVLGPLLTALPLRDYATDPATATYLPRNLSLAFLQHDLPGLFADNPVAFTTNGSLWTLFYEVAWYGAVFCLGTAGALRTGSRFAWAMGFFLVVYLGLMTLDLGGELPNRLRRLLQLGLPFMIGTAFYVWRDRIRLRPSLLLALVLLAALARGTPLSSPLQILTLAYGAFVFAFRVGGPVRAYNAVGDFSYGLYIYAYPVQQTAAHLLGPGDPALNVLFAAPVALLLAAASWRWIEKPALDLVPRPEREPERGPGRGPGRGPRRGTWLGRGLRRTEPHSRGPML